MFIGEQVQAFSDECAQPMDRKISLFSALELFKASSWILDSTFRGNVYPIKP